MASVDTAMVTVTGKGGHGATPHECVDPVVAIVGMVQAIQTIVSRNIYALDEVGDLGDADPCRDGQQHHPRTRLVHAHDPVVRPGRPGAAEETDPRDGRGPCGGLWGDGGGRL